MATWLLTKLTGVERIEVMAAWPHIWGTGTQLAWGAGYRESSQKSRPEFPFTGRQHPIPGQAMS